MTFWRTVGALWVAPVALVIWIFYVLPAWWLGWYTFDGWARPGVVRFRVTSPEGHWHTHAWAWANGLALPYAIFLNHHTTVVTELHELRHTDQWLLLGPLFPLVYGVLLAAEGYENHSLEEDARDWARKEWAWHLKQEEP
jgi:hypothetical protein